MDGTEKAGRYEQTDNTAEAAGMPEKTALPGEKIFPTLGKLTILQKAAASAEPEKQPAEAAEPAAPAASDSPEEAPEEEAPALPALEEAAPALPASEETALDLSGSPEKMKPAAGPAPQPRPAEQKPAPSAPAAADRQEPLPEPEHPAAEPEKQPAASTAPELRSDRLASVVRLQEEAARQAAQEKQRRERLQREQAYLEKMIDDVQADLKESSADREFNDQFEAQIRTQVYQMHGISGDRLEGMVQSRQAWYRGASFALFLLSLLLYLTCGVLHGFGAQLSVFVAFYMGVEGALLAVRDTGIRVWNVLLKVLYMLLFPAAMVIFTCYELGFSDSYARLLPVFTVVGIVVLSLAAASYFAYDHYHDTRKKCREAERYMRKLEKTAAREMRLQEKKEKRRQTGGNAARKS